MWGSRTLWVAVEALVVVFVVAMVAGQLVGQPILLSYVTTGSMEPTLDPGDGYVAVPADLAGPIEPGDVITFRAEELHQGGLTTHRVVRETDRGFVTKGDANPFTDQDGAEPPVKREQVVAVAWRPGGTVIAIPAVGTIVEGSQTVLGGMQRWLAATLGLRSLLGTTGIAYLVFAVTAVWYLVETYRERGGADRDRSRTNSRDDGVDPRLVAGALALVVIGSATAAMVAPAGTQKYGIVSAESDAPGARIIEQGTSESFTYPVGNAGVVPVYAFVEGGSDGVTVTDGDRYVPGREVRNATVTLSAPPETGYYRKFVTEHRYLALLPQQHVHAMYEVHPWLPLLVIDALVGLPFYLLGMALLGTGRVRRRSTDRPSGLDRFLAKFR